MARNEDYKKGMRFLLQKCKESGINIRTVEWVPIYSSFLSERDSCYKFWFNVWEQGRLHKIKECDTLNDIALDCSKLLFYWCDTREGDDYWKRVLLFDENVKYNINRLLTSFV